MTDKYLFEPTVTTVPIEGRTESFPVRRIYCVGRNYAEHIREMGGDARQPPFFFQKPTDAIVHDGATVAYPPYTQDFQHEIELVLAIGKGGRDIAKEEASAHVFGVAIGIDLTRRDVQVEARKAGRPWEIGKSFDRSAPIGAIRPIADRGIPSTGFIELLVNDEVRQRGDLSEMIWKPAEIVSKLSEQYRIEPGDLIYTGTPSGVGPMSVGDRVKGRIESLGAIAVLIAPPGE
ncbi:hypothetical protein ASE00_20975 [Sphingomonas sp. Root710]|uniref:fumarylacetoacetate hydrolase family protein n=1 Tax=Sphingomonas sp. Root710 TaxID=1736594 RepID=UPI0006F861D3|nr:fumarylacetoacetate hydrolase family protein [Sphingomonas sp. Root710]KRB78853.1 hypothetical protein ASE00_20975 [Sphingomonas sp. Root710]